MRIQLRTEARPKPCIRHSDRRATHARITVRVKPARGTYRIPECAECAARKLRAKDMAGIVSTEVVKL